MRRVGGAAELLREKSYFFFFEVFFFAVFLAAFLAFFAVFFFAIGIVSHLLGATDDGLKPSVGYQQTSLHVISDSHSPDRERARREVDQVRQFPAVLTGDGGPVGGPFLAGSADDYPFAVFCLNDPRDWFDGGFARM